MKQSKGFGKSALLVETQESLATLGFAVEDSAGTKGYEVPGYFGDSIGL